MFFLCKNCFAYGDNYNHNCTECFSGYNLIEGSYYKNNCEKYCKSYNFDKDLNLYYCSLENKKDEMIDDLDSLIKEKEPSESFIINGRDYSLLIFPIGKNIENNFNIDFSKFNTKLKENNPNVELKIVQLSLDYTEEYRLYNQSGDKMDLSICKDSELMVENEKIDIIGDKIEYINII